MTSTTPETPELDKQAAVIATGKASIVQDFIDWLVASGYSILKRCEVPVHETGWYCGACSNTGYSGSVYDFNALMAEHFEIDLKKIEEERQSLLQYLRDRHTEC